MADTTSLSEKLGVLAVADEHGGVDGHDDRVPGVQNCVPSGTLEIALQRLRVFSQLLQFLNRAPWAQCDFDPNECVLWQMIGLHLHIILGEDGKDNPIRVEVIKKWYIAYLGVKDTHTGLFWSRCDDAARLASLSKFLFALAALGCLGGRDMVYIYSSLHARTHVLLENVKRYMRWFVDEGNVAAVSFRKEVSMHLPQIIEDSPKTLVLLSHYNVRTVIRTRPNQVTDGPHQGDDPDSCRGDTAHATIFADIEYVAFI
eukprot:m.1638368 g.1638368  ORF g.1638368 m.1638368 type:complete len:258 (-) comp27800_c0_seq1:29-802(-)